MRNASRLAVAVGFGVLATALAPLVAAADPRDNSGNKPSNGLPQPRRLSEETVRARLAELDVRPSPGKSGWLRLGTWRVPELHLGDAGFELVMDWNGLDDDRWPATRIAEVLASEICGQIPAGSVSELLDRLYQSRSLVPEVNLGGNAGTRFKKRQSASLGACKVDLLAEGARWHTLSITVGQ